MIRGFRPTLAVLMICIAGCGGITVRKVTPENDARLPGFRYYLARPYVAVKRPFPLSGTEYLVRGTVVKLENGTLGVGELKLNALPEGVQSTLRSQFGETPLLALPDAMPSDARLAPKSSSPVATSTPADGPKSDKPTAENPEASADPKQESTKSSGSGSDPVLKLNDLFDVVMLPDFDQQYAIQIEPSGGGKTEASLTFRDGWMLEGVNSTVDNTAVTNAVKDTIGKLIDVATGFIPKPPAVAATANQPTKTTGDSDKMRIAQAREGTTVLLRLMLLNEAQPGLYPLLKPSEWRKPSKKDGTIDPGVGAAVCAEARPTEGCSSGGTKIPVALPCPPYSLVPFNYESRVTVTLVQVGTPPTPVAGGNGQ